MAHKLVRTCYSKKIIIILSLHASITFFCSPITYVSHLLSLLKSSSFWLINYSHVHCIYLICFGPKVLDYVTIRSCQGFQAQVFFPNHVPFTPLICGASSSQSIRLPNIDYDVLDLIKKEANRENIKKRKKYELNHHFQDTMGYKTTLHRICGRHCWEGALSEMQNL